MYGSEALGTSQLSHKRASAQTCASLFFCFEGCFVWRASVKQYFYVMKIGRTLFWFTNGDESLLMLTDQFFSFGYLLNRLLNEVYNGKRIQFINIYFYSNETYHLYPVLPKNDAHFGGGHLRYNGLLDFSKFDELSEEAQHYFIWEKAFEYLQQTAKTLKNDDLLEASQYAYQKGIATKLNPDYRMIEADILLFDQPLKAAVWLNFKEDGMYSKLTLEKNGEIIFEKHIDKTRTGIEFFLVMYKGIVVKDNVLIVKGHKDVDYLPLKILIDKDVIMGS